MDQGVLSGVSARKIRGGILIFSLALSLAVSALVAFSVPSDTLKIIRLTQTFGLFALVFLYLTLLIGPFSYAFPRFPYRKQLFFARRATGLSVFYFALLHGNLAFFGQFGGFEGLAFLSPAYIVALSAAAGALFIFFLLSLTANDKALNFLGFPVWKSLHRLVYAAGVLVLWHALLLGTHFRDLTTAFPYLAFLLLAFLLLLQAHRLDGSAGPFLRGLRRFGLSVVLVFAFLTWAFTSLVGREGFSLSLHAAHGQDSAPTGSHSHGAEQRGGEESGKAPGGVNVSLGLSPSPEVGKKSTLSFSLSEAETGTRLVSFVPIHQEPAHLFVMKEGMSWYDYRFPAWKGNAFVEELSFPAPGRYRLYFETQPEGTAYVRTVFSLEVASSGPKNPGTKPAELSSVPRAAEALSRDGDARVTLLLDGQVLGVSGGHGGAGSVPDSVEAGGPAPESESTYVREPGGEPALTLRFEREFSSEEPPEVDAYLDAFAHGFLVNESNFRLLHLHALNRPGKNGGARLLSFPRDESSAFFEPGNYRFFVYAKLDGRLVTADFPFTVKEKQ